ncbi:MAG: response regulator [Rectinemataceae bacterium]|nr:response regulator [Rectinemataceae bacterium]
MTAAPLFNPGGRMVVPVNSENKKRIIIADDERINLEFFDVMLTNLGFDVKTADNGVDCLEVLSRWRPDLILTDNVMPRLSGWEVTKRVRTAPEYAEFADVPIIMFSAMDDVKDKVEGLELGADDYITKPFHFTEVLARIRALLRTRELVSQIERREARIQVAEDIAKHVIAFADSLRTPLSALAEEAVKILPECSTAAEFVQKALNEVTSALSRLETLDEAVIMLKKQAEEIKREETSIPVLKKKISATS